MIPITFNKMKAYQLHNKKYHSTFDSERQNFA